MPDKQTNLSELAAAAKALQQSRKTLLLSSRNQQGDPEISYAPYLRADDGAFYIFISDLAAHTRNLREYPQVAIMFIADERESQNLYARERLIYQCDVECISRLHSECERLLDQMQAVQGNIVGMLRGLGDFNLFRLVPTQGTYVVGFGKAYEVGPDGELVHISEERLKERRDD